ncbi:MAG: ZIP family metal transporter [Planctomycetaceae bacterium]|nr:ZIP family metal transporter [Planctomycetales bacterium]MCB9873010.1 ZIP family metal transporter [Planctomycetaceae bacterium]MCB9937003.1 ZIP family metal transporter [Planctomycetaceae bacterium]HRX81154.1 ZIP family metal transporter [Pirellulaceae bacterium]
MPDMLLIVYCVLIVVASLLGGWLPFLVNLTHRRMQLLMSFVGGLMLGVALLHLIPHALAEAQSVDHVAYSVVAGVLLTFFMIRFFHVHQHGHEVGDGHEHHEDTCDHGPHEHAHGSDHTHTHHLSWSGLFFGLAMHTFFDGLALGASVTAGSHGEGAVLVGIGTFLAIVLHKPLDSLSLTCVMSGGRWTRKSITLVNLAFASMCPLGAIVFCFGLGGLASSQPIILSCALGFAGGIFLCISLADILPELQFHHHDRGLLSVALLFGVLLAYLIGFVESGHGHSHDHGGAKTPIQSSEPEHSHSEHDHAH